jgi:tetratricopeptide (TPR) repeat protein
MFEQLEHVRFETLLAATYDVISLLRGEHVTRSEAGTSVFDDILYEIERDARRPIGALSIGEREWYAGRLAAIVTARNRNETAHLATAAQQELAALRGETKTHPLDAGADAAKRLADDALACARDGAWTNAETACRSLAKAAVGTQDLRIATYAVASLFNIGTEALAVGRSEYALACFTTLIASIGDVADKVFLDYLAKAMVNQGLAYGRTGKVSNEIRTYESLLQRFERLDSRHIRDSRARAMLNLSIRLREEKRYRDALDVTDALLAALDPSGDYRRLFAVGLLNRALCFGGLSEPDDEIETYGKIVSSFISEPDVAAQALFNLGVALGEIGRKSEEIRAYDELVKFFASSADPTVQEHVSRARYNRSLVIAPTLGGPQGPSEIDRIIRGIRKRDTIPESDTH